MHRAVVVTTVLLAAAGIVLAIPHVLFWGRILPGVSVAGLAVGGQRPANAAVAIAGPLGERPRLTQVALAEPDGDRTWSFTAAELGLAVDPAASAQRAMAVGRTGGAAARLFGPWQVIAGERDVPPVWAVRNDTAEALDEVAEAVTEPPQNARIEVVDGQHVVRAAQLGHTLDRGGTLAAVAAALSAGDGAPRVAVVVAATAPRVGSLTDVAAAFELVTSGPVTVRFRNEVSEVVPLEVVRQWASLEDLPNEAGDSVPTIVFDRASITEWVASLAPRVNAPAREPRFAYDRNLLQARVIDPGRLGATLDVETSVDRIIDATYTELRVVELGAEMSSPQFVPQDVARLHGAHDASRAFTTVTGQDEARLAHIAAAATALQGVALAPGQEFSFLQTLGEVTPEAGYLFSLLRPDPAAPPGWLGGMEQVSSTYYRAAFWAGLAVLERHSAPVRVGWLEPPVGLDASVEAPERDLRFVNTTESVLLLENAIEPARGAFRVTILAYPPLTSSLTVEGPVVTEITAPPEDIVRAVPDLPPGTRLQAQYAREGAKVRIVRTVHPGSTLGFSEVVESAYPPAPAVMLTGSPR